MYFYKSIFILNGATTYLIIWHTLIKFSHIPLFTQQSKIKKNKKNKNISLPTYPETEEYFGNRLIFF